MTAPKSTPLILIDETERQKCEIWTRVMGYHRPVTSFNIGKIGEFYERKFFVENQERRAQKQQQALADLRPCSADHP